MVCVIFISKINGFLFLYHQEAKIRHYNLQKLIVDQI